MSRAEREAMLQLMEQSQNAVAVFTGIRQQFIDAGWTSVGAERMVHEMLRQQSGRNQ